jgi:hypothetical protein
MDTIEMKRNPDGSLMTGNGYFEGRPLEWRIFGIEQKQVVEYLKEMRDDLRKGVLIEPRQEGYLKGVEKGFLQTLSEWDDVESSIKSHVCVLIRSNFRTNLVVASILNGGVSKTVLNRWIDSVIKNPSSYVQYVNR